MSGNSILLRLPVQDSKVNKSRMPSLGWRQNLPFSARFGAFESGGHDVGSLMKVIGQDARIFLLDDNAPLHASVVASLAASGIKVEAYSIEDFLDHVDLSAGGCILLNVRLLNKSGLKLHRELQCVSAIWPIVYLSDCPDIRVAVEAMKLGAIDFLTKPIHLPSLFDSLHRARIICASNLKLLNERNNLHRRLKLLTSRELQVLELLAQGWLNKQIAAYLEVCVRTIETRRAAIQRKLELKSIVEIIWEIGRFDFELTGSPVAMYDHSRHKNTPPFFSLSAQKNVMNTPPFNSYLFSGSCTLADGA